MSEAVIRINPEGLVHDTIGGEAIVLNVKSGTYYNLVGTAAEVWGLLAIGGSVEELCSVLEGHYGASSQLSEDVQKFVQTLQADMLVITAERDAGAALPDALESEAKDWVAPSLTAYEDLQDLLTIDPIHDVDDTGWPNAKPS
jgi:hypothetical protein